MRSLLVLLVAVSACAGRYHTADVSQTQLDAALTARAQLSYYFLQLGAIKRPPRPAPIADNGFWEWREGAWQWRGGRWGDPDPGDAGAAVAGPNVADASPTNADVDVPFSFSDDVITNPPWDERGEVKTRAPRSHPSETDWRAPLHPDATVRDHRTKGGSSGGSSWSSSSAPDATVRDHRDDSRDDHNDDRSSNQDFGGVRFGHPH